MYIHVKVKAKTVNQLNTKLDSKLKQNLEQPTIYTHKVHSFISRDLVEDDADSTKIAYEYVYLLEQI